MFSRNRSKYSAVLVCLFAACACSSGCLGRHLVNPSVENGGVPTELNKITLPDHVIGPPDILLIDAVTLVPRPPYLIKPLDALAIEVRIVGAVDDDKDRDRSS